MQHDVGVNVDCVTIIVYSVMKTRGAVAQWVEHQNVDLENAPRILNCCVELGMLVDPTLLMFTHLCDRLPGCRQRH